MKKGDIYHIDTYEIPQYLERFIDDIVLLENVGKYKDVLAYSEKYQANILVLVKDLKYFIRWFLRKSEHNKQYQTKGG